MCGHACVQKLLTTNKFVHVNLKGMAIAPIQCILRLLNCGEILLFPFPL